MRYKMAVQSGVLGIIWFRFVQKHQIWLAHVIMFEILTGVKTGDSRGRHIDKLQNDAIRVRCKL